MCRVLTIAAAPANGNRHTGPVGALRFGFLVFVVLGVIVGVPSVLVVLTFVTTRALVRGRRRRMVAAAAWWRYRADGATPLDIGAQPNLRLA